MFQQYIGDGANIFIAIVAVLVGFATALGYVDFLKTKKQQQKKDWFTTYPTFIKEVTLYYKKGAPSASLFLFLIDWVNPRNPINPRNLWS